MGTINRFGYPGLISCTIKPVGDTQEVDNQIPVVMEFDLDQFAREMININSVAWAFQHDCTITGVTLHSLHGGPELYKIDLTIPVMVSSYGSMGIAQGGVRVSAELFDVIQEANRINEEYIIDEVPI